MKVRNDHGINVVIGQSHSGKHVVEVDLGIDLIPVALAPLPSIAHTDVNKDALIAGIDEQKIAGKNYAIELVSRQQFVPKWFGNDAEHGATVELVCALTNDRDF